MSYDEEAVVRERLHRVLPAVDVAAPVSAGTRRGAVEGRPLPTGVPPGGGDLAGVRTGRPPPSPGQVDDVLSITVNPRPPSDAEPLTPMDSGHPRNAAIPAGQDDGDGPSRLPGPGAFDPGRRGVRVLAVVAVLVVLGAAFWAWRSRPQAEPVAPVADSVGPSALAGSEPSATPGGELVVAVAGKVRRPGLVRVPAGARVADAVQAAGGALPGVDVALLNLARKVADGELILVGVAAPPGVAPAGPAAGAVPGAGGKVNLNTATLAQLDALPGVGPVLAQRILSHRDQQGGFRSVSDLRQVDGIGDARYEQLKDLVTV
ncbi:ComEA family DNA-binding protein [Micromonospora sp. NPDC047707]|uniref:ComEA family DNA-binding protein n=1 Tax=Micromonospora sp. NPDC047707 TaxID=3154498 RepID=UPI00345264C8